MIDHSRVLVLSNHYYRSLYFEETMQDLWDKGFKNIFIQDTGSEAWGPYQGPKSFYHRSGVISYDQGMVNFKKLLSGIDYDVILMIDNDCFIKDISQVNKFIHDFQQDNYEFSCHHVTKKMYDGYQFGDSTISHVTNQTFEPCDIYPGFKPYPHWENAYLLITRKVWDSLSSNDISHGRKWLRAMWNMGVKMGAHIANFRMTYTQHGEGWFHVGNLMAYYHKLEKNELFDRSSQLDMSRLGYFYAQEAKYGSDTYSSTIKARLDNIPPQVIAKAMEAWKLLVNNTCMEI